MSDWSQLLGMQQAQQSDYAAQQRAMQNVANNQYGSYINSMTCGDYIPTVQWAGAPKEQPKPTQEKRGMFSEIASDIKKFILEYRAVLYFIGAALIVDHFFFKGAFRMRLQSMADSIVAKVEKKIAA